MALGIQYLQKHRMRIRLCETKIKTELFRAGKVGKRARALMDRWLRMQFCVSDSPVGFAKHSMYCIYRTERLVHIFIDGRIHFQLYKFNSIRKFKVGFKRQLRAKFETNGFQINR